MNQYGLTSEQKDMIRQSIPAMRSKGFGDAADIINGLYKLGGVLVSYTTNATINTADTVAHNLGYVPNGYIVIDNGNGGVVYSGGTATATTIPLKCTTASNAVTLMVF